MIWREAIEEEAAQHQSFVLWWIFLMHLLENNFILLLSQTAGIIFTGEIPSQLQLFAKNLIYVV